MICSQITVEERCFGCPLTEFEDRRGLQLQPYEELVFGTNFAAVMNQSYDGMNQRQLVDSITEAALRIEKAARQMYGLVRDVAIWRAVDACLYHDGDVLPEDTEMSQKLKDIFNKVKERNNGEDF